VVPDLSSPAHQVAAQLVEQTVPPVILLLVSLAIMDMVLMEHLVLLVELLLANAL
jgi:hypothetical protein